MATNAQSTRPLGTPSEQPTTVTTPTTPVVTSTGAGSVGVYDRDVDTTTPPGHHRATMADSRPASSNLTWIISVILLIVLVYFLLQWIF